MDFDACQYAILAEIRGCGRNLGVLAALTRRNRHHYRLCKRLKCGRIFRKRFQGERKRFLYAKINENINGLESLKVQARFLRPDTWYHFGVTKEGRKEGRKSGVIAYSQYIFAIKYKRTSARRCPWLLFIPQIRGILPFGFEI